MEVPAMALPPGRRRNAAERAAARRRCQVESEKGREARTTRQAIARNRRTAAG